MSQKELRAMTVQCPDCGLDFDAQHDFCPRCGRPRSHVEADLRSAAAETGVPYATLLAEAREIDIQQQRDRVARSNKRWLIGIAIVGALFVGLVLIAALAPNGEPTTVLSQPADTNRPSTNAEITYTVKTVKVARRVPIRYNNASGGFEQAHAGATDTWTASYRMSAGEHAYVTATIPYDGRGSVKCTIHIDGTLVDSQSASGASGNVTCSVIVDL